MFIINYFINKSFVEMVKRNIGTTKKQISAFNIWQKELLIKEEAWLPY